MLCKSELQKKARTELSSKAKSAAAAALELEFFVSNFLVSLFAVPSLYHKALQVHTPPCKNQTLQSPDDCTM